MPIHLDERTRAYIYRVLAAALAVAIGYGLVTSEEAALWLAAATAVLSIPLAVANTSTD